MNRYERIDFDELESLSFAGGAEGEDESRGLPITFSLLTLFTIKNCLPPITVVKTKPPVCYLADRS